MKFRFHRYIAVLAGLSFILSSVGCAMVNNTDEYNKEEKKLSRKMAPRNITIKKSDLPTRMLPSQIKVSPPPKPMPVIRNFAISDEPLGNALVLMLSKKRYSVEADDTIDLARHVGMIQIDEMPLDKAVNRILMGTGYAYKIDNENQVVSIQSVITRIWRLPLPNIVETAESDLTAGGEQISETESAYSGVSSSKKTTQASEGVRIKTKSLIKDPWRDIHTNIEKYLSQRGKLLLDRSTGTISVTDKPSVVAAVGAYLRKIVATMSMQVLLEVEIYEVELSDRFELGVNWEKLPGLVGDGWRTGLKIAGAPLSAINLTSGSGAGNLMIGYGDTSAVIGALKQFGKVDIMANQRLLCKNGKTAQMFSGDNNPFLANYQDFSSGDAIRFQVQTGSAKTGVAMAVTPTVDDSRNIILSVVPILSTLLDIVEFKPSDSVSISRPRIKTREMRTEIYLKSGQTVFMGGLRYTRDVKEHGGLPLLKDIPVLGALFRNTDDKKQRVEMVISIKAYLNDMSNIALKGFESKL
jgi:type IVB pilus formation R64 PilN family outer membrane protein